MRNNCNAVAGVFLTALILAGTLIWHGIVTVPPAVADPPTSCGPDQATAVQSAISQMPPPQLASKIDAHWSPNVWPPNSNYDPCADLSTVLITIEHATGSSPMQALMFHRGTFLGTGTVEDYSFMTLDKAASTNNTVVINYKDGRNVCTACPGPITTVRYQWQGDHVVMLDPAPPW
ncbi:MAG: LppP/LprE family lipoprotein [Mycobacteriaceae bacterium]|nr:LppP/LprE family lipoprotein [Mycobacteriaceae bacterium]